MGILLLAECWPYRNVKAGSFDTSQGRLLAETCHLSIEELQQVCTCKYVIDRYVPSWRKTKQYENEIRGTLINNDNSYILHHALTICLGKRLLSILSKHGADFFTRYYYYIDGKLVKPLRSVACIPNPLAEYWWKEDDNIEQVTDFMKHMFTMYGH